MNSHDKAAQVSANNGFYREGLSADRAVWGAGREGREASRMGQGAQEGYAAAVGNIVSGLDVGLENLVRGAWAGFGSDSGAI